MNIIFFSYNYPYSIDYSWKRNELSELAKHYKIMLIPYMANSKIPLSNVPEGIEVLQPLVNNEIKGKWQQLVILILSKRRLFYFREFFREKVFKNKSWIQDWLATVVMTERLLKHPIIKSLLSFKEENKNTILYFYWGLGTTLILPFLKNARYFKVIVRFHGFDLYAERRNFYLPFRTDMLKSIDFAIPISEDGKAYLQNRYPNLNLKFKVFRLGVKKNGESFASSDGVLRIVTCSHVIALKRLEIVSQALKHVDFSVEWTHFGDGLLFDQLKMNVRKLPSNVLVNLIGRVTNGEVLKFYSNHPVDLFVNVSSTEGVPVSIMEALAAGIPVYATNVGGTHEIVDKSNGKLLDKEITHTDLANELKLFYNMSEIEKLQLRKTALETYKMKCDFNRLNSEFISFLNDKEPILEF
jgi:colanic acid/amylovoran biosynthesis glycosyltransferase